MLTIIITAEVSIIPFKIKEEAIAFIKMVVTIIINNKIPLN